MTSDKSPNIVKQISPTLVTLPQELLCEIYQNIELGHLHHKLSRVSKIFKKTITPFILRELTVRLAKHPKLSTYDQEVKIENDLLLLTLKGKIAPFDVFPWQIRMIKLTTIDKLLRILTRVVEHIERVQQGKIVGQIDEKESDLVVRKRWAWINC
ncbi:hypothetical protein G9A89_002492 [Geosiphon pyriformis]|nr:hypothetical protein G9A89_002492 [Geosiphon pyriformis]